jgi:hypothetical protein
MARGRERGEGGQAGRNGGADERCGAAVGVGRRRWKMEQRGWVVGAGGGAGVRRARTHSSTDMLCRRCLGSTREPAATDGARVLTGPCRRRLGTTRGPAAPGLREDGATGGSPAPPGPAAKGPPGPTRGAGRRVHSAKRLMGPRSGGRAGGPQFRRTPGSRRRQRSVNRRPPACPADIRQIPNARQAEVEAATPTAA